MVKFNPEYNAIILGMLLSAADKMGINPVLLGRQTSRLLAPLLDGIFKQYIGRGPSSNPEQLLEDIKTIVKAGEISDPEGLELEYSENRFNMKVIECMYLDMANYGKTLGYNACPMCIAGVFFMGLVNSLGIGEVLDFTVENKENSCTLKIIVM